MASEAIEQMVRQHRALKNKEILAIKEVQKEVGHYASVFFKPVKRIKGCNCDNREFLCNSFVYLFGLVFRVSDKLTICGVACYHFNHQPDQAKLDNFSLMYQRGKHPTFFREAETRLEEQFEAAFKVA